MANAKISNDTIFVPETNISNIDGLAGFAGTGNVKITGTALVASLETTLNLNNFNTGTLSVGRGGTGATTFTANGILIGNTGSAISATAELTDGQLLIGSTGNAPVAATLTGSTGITVTDASGSISISNDLATNSARGGIQIGATGLGAKEYAVQLSSEKAYVAVPWVNTTYSTFTYNSSTPASSTSGLVPAPTTSGDNVKFLRGDATWVVPTDTTYNVFTGADGSNAGSTGLVPQPTATDNVKFLTGAATWATPTDTTYSAMTDSVLGLGKLRYATNSTPAAELQSVTASRTYGITENSSNQLVVNVPWTDTATDAAGTTGQIQYSNGSNPAGFAASANLTYDSDTLTVQDNIVIKGDGSAEASKLRFNCWNNNHYVDVIGPDHGNSPLSYSITLPNKIATQSAVSGGRVLEVNSSGVGNWIATPTYTDTSIYAANGALTSARSVTMGTHNLTFASTTAGQEVKFQQNVRIDGQSYTPLETISSVTSWTPDWDSGNVQTMELNAATTINNPSNIEIGATYIMILKQDSTGSRTVTWGNAYNFSANTPPILTTGANKADVITLVAYSSTVLMCTSVLDFQTS